jgi:hypothetical protein
MPNVKLCSHIKVTGVRCGSPALRGEEFCYFHQRMLRGIQTPPEARLHPIALIENEEAIQSSLMEVINAIARNSIDLRRADLILKALHIAVKNSRRIRFDLNTASMVQEVPDYPAPTRAEIGRVGTDRVGTGTPARPEKSLAGTSALACPERSRRGCPSGPEVSDRSESTTEQSAAVDPTQPKPSHSVREAPKERKNAAHGASRG